MPDSPHPPRTLTAVLALVVTLVTILTGLLLWRGRVPALPGPGTEAYEQVSTLFYRGLASLQVGLLDDAIQDFTRAAELVPAEPATWANLGVSRLRLGEVDIASEPIERAMVLAPDNSDVALLAAQMEIARGQLDAGIAHLRRAIDLDPDALRARFALADELERTGTPDTDAEAMQLLDELLERAPTNLAVLLDRARVAAKVQDAARLTDSIARLGAVAATWPPIAVEQYQLLRDAASTGDFTQAARATALLRNVLARVPAYASDVSQVRTSTEVVAEPFERFLALAEPVSTPAAPDTGVRFTPELLGVQPVSTMIAVSLDGRERVTPFVVTGSTIRGLDGSSGAWPFPGDVPGWNGLLALDWNNDFRTDLFAAGTSGVRLLLQDEAGGFQDATAAAAAGSPIAYAGSGAWPADIDMDGDLDIVLGIANGATTVLRNNGDGTWVALPTFATVTHAVHFAWADLDNDADPDAVFLDAAGNLRVLLNRQAGEFVEITPPAGVRNATGMTVADINADGRFDIVVTSSASDIRHASLDSHGEWVEGVLVPAPPDAAPDATRPVRLLAVDLDNNGALDLVRSGTATRIWLADESHRLVEQPAGIDALVTAAADLDDDGRIDLLGISSGEAVRLLGAGDRDYHWKRIHVRAQPVAGDQRINSFAVGGEIEVRSALLRQKQTLTGMPVHFGLGTRTSIDVARIVWPNGVSQAEFDAAVDDAIVAEQRLKGSCPWVFAYDGRQMQFVTDFLWRSPLGLRINAQDTAGVSETGDWVRIRGDQLRPQDGVYDVRITAELWETHFVDHVSLLVVDHPADTEAFVDERFSTGPVRLAVQAFRDVQPVVRATDATGRDVTDLVARQDGRHLSTFERGRYQGIAREHFVEVEIAEPHRQEARLVLIAQGWVYPTDSSINMAIGQGRHDPPRGVMLEAQDVTGRWIVVEPDLGFPAGKNKTMLIDLSGIPDARRLRLRTNMEVSWDALATARPADDIELRTVRLEAAVADLRHRGYSRTISPRGDAPETPLYDQLAATGQRWRDLVGYHTRFGDVRELLVDVDDRYVIMGAGDELRLAFRAPAEPGDGWVRDFVLIGDGWVKDGDYNTEFSQTVLPLPSHGAVPYDASRPPGELEDDPVYRRHRADWERYHTRYMAPRAFVRGLASN